MSEHRPPPADPSVSLAAGLGHDRAGSELGAPAGSAGSDPEETGPSFTRNLLEWVAILVGALVVALVGTRFLIQAFFIPSLSMSPTLDVADRVLVNKLSYDLHAVNRGDLVVFERPASEADSAIKDLIKRVVALEGETVESRDGRLFVNGEPLDEPYLAPNVQTNGVEATTVPPGHVFVMGDNRTDSRDSRFFGPLPEELIIGRAFVKVWPLLDVGLL